MVNNPFDIKPIKRLIFEHRNPMPFVNSGENFTECNWFSDSQGLLLGVILEDRGLKNWAYSILDADHNCRLTWKRSGKFPTQADAESALISGMEKALTKYHPHE